MWVDLNVNQWGMHGRVNIVEIRGSHALAFFIQEIVKNKKRSGLTWRFIT